MELIIMIFVTEAIVNLLFKAAPLQPAREWIIDHTQFLYSSRMDSHLLECPYCTSVWVAAFSTSLLFLWSFIPVQLFCYTMLFHRASNFLHETFGYIKDLQIDCRIRRKR